MKDAKYPEKFVVTRYKDARDCTKNYLGGLMNEDNVLEAIAAIGDREPETEFQEQDFRLSIDALEAMLDGDTSTLNGMLSSPFRGENKLMEIQGVDISINPDLIVQKSIDDVIHVGAIKLHISKHNQLSDESQKIVAILLYQYADLYIKKEGELASVKTCFSFDLFKQHIEGCPSSYKHRLARIETACEEIAMWWQRL